jgi:uncharacterized protein YdhG (YjbR/CyaY superfamily)
MTSEVDTILARLPKDQQAALERLRAEIARSAPDAVEGISYGAPAFRYRGRPLVSYGAAKAHCAFYVMSPAVMEAHAEALAGYDTSKGTIRFASDEPLPPGLVRKLVEARIAEIDAARPATRRRPDATRS